MSWRGLPIALFLGASPALAFDTGKLGQWGSLSLADLKPVISKSAKLQREVDQALAERSKKQDDVMCDARRFPGSWVNLGGERVSPYSCDFGGKWLQIQAAVRVTDRNGRAIEAITASGMKNASKVIETNLTWKWTTEDPSKSE